MPTGAINGLFSVSDTKQVYFSQGNLQYQASTNTWRFAENQYDYVGEANSNISSYNDGWIDLFGWGTSGYNHGAVCYQPWSISETYSDYYAYGEAYYNLYDQTGQADWGYNPISNGGNNFCLWRALTYSEWIYLLTSRNTSSGVLYAKAKVNGTNGLILLPDDWDASVILNNTNTINSNYTSNIISITEWTYSFEAKGVVFLPAAGHRGLDISINDVGSFGLYWSATQRSEWENSAYMIYFHKSDFSYNISNNRVSGLSVRLVHDAE